MEARCTDLVCGTNPAGAASLTLGEQQRGTLKDGPGGSPVLPARQKRAKGYQTQRMNTPREAQLLRSPHFLPVLGDLCHIQNAALLRRLEEDRKASVGASHTRSEDKTPRRSTVTASTLHHQSSHVLQLLRSFIRSNKPSQSGGRNLIKRTCLAFVTSAAPLSFNFQGKNLHSIKN